MSTKKETAPVQDEIVEVVDPKTGKKKKIIKRKMKSYPKTPIVISIFVVTIGVILCCLSWLPNFSFFGIPAGYLGIPAGILLVIAVVYQYWLIKCPYCGSRKFGRAIGFKAKVPKTVQCPECSRNVLIKNKSKQK